MNLVLSIIIFTQLVTPYETKVFLDADGMFLIYARYFQGELLGIDSVKSVYDHLTAGIMIRNLDLLREELKKDFLQQGGYASQGLFGTFEVPLPKGGFRDFMGETGKLDVGGYVKISLGGSETFVSNLPGESKPSLLPELEMKQEMAINLDGQVGDRMRVYMDHNSERINETQNKITVTYQGREDEIIQEIEGGDTQLSIPATTYTGDIPSHRGLFGIKATAKLGPLDLVTIASREQTQTEEIEITGSTQAQYDTIWARYYQRRRFFRLGTNDRIIKLEVYVDDNESMNNNIGVNYYGTAYVDTNDDNTPDDVEDFMTGYFTLKMENDDYRFLNESNIVELNSGLPARYALGVRYKKLVNGDTIEVGQIFQTDTLVDSIQLKLICPRDEYDTLSVTWDYELRNYYQVVSPGSRLDSLRIYQKLSGGEDIDKQDGIPFIALLGLDTSPEDGMVDYNRVFLEDRGLLIFPDPEPFASDILDEPQPQIYTNPQEVGYGKYYIFVKTMEAKPVYTLPENVEQVWVYVDDLEQDSIQDYHVDYDQGILEFKRPILPGQKVRIKVEYAPFFSAAEKSLLGIRGSMRPFGDASLGSSFFYRTESYPAERIRLREEPFNRMIWEMDFAYPQELPFLTKLVDGLPLVETEAQSKLNVNFEGAYSFSDLNARGEVYVDDLESATIVSNDFSISKTSWVLGSQPVGKESNDFVSQRIIWYNPRDEDRLQASDIYEDPEDENEITDVLKVVFNPDPGNVLSFGGLTQYIYSENFDEVENLELIVKGNGGRFHVDFAQEISEDQLRRNKDGMLVGIGTREDEDKNKDFVWTQQDEDTGLDTIFGDDGSNIPGDDGNDDYDEDGYTGAIDGTEMNRLWDTEDLDRNGVLNSQNKYYSYSVDLDDTTQYDTTGLRDGWKLFRIAIKDSANWDTLIGQPDWRNIRYVRIWFDRFASTETLFIYKISATGSRWKNYGIAWDKLPPYTNEVFALTPVNTKAHPYYRPPYPLEKDEFGRIKTEGGLEFRLENIRQGHTCVAHRRTDDNEDYRAYDTLTFYLLSALNDTLVSHNFLISFRMGSDSLNYYEYTTDYDEGIKGYNDYHLYSIGMQRFLDLKREKTTASDTISDSLYTVVGNPSFSKNQFFEVRITNPSAAALSDTIWFNDIRLVAPKKEVGRIFRGNGTLNFADLASVSFAYNESNGRFKRLSESKDISTQSAYRRYSIGSSIGLSKFLPAEWGFNIPLGLNYSNSVTDPRFSYFSDDIEITDEEGDEQQSKQISKSYSISFAKSNSRNWLLSNTIDRLSLSHERSQSYLRSTLDADTSDLKSYRAAYTLNPKFDFKILNQAFSLLPQTISLNALYNDNKVRTYYRADIDSTFKLSDYGVQEKKTLEPSISVSYSPHSVLSASYNFSQSRDSVGTRGRYGEEVARDQTLNTSLAPDLKIISPRLTFNSSYHEDHTFEIRQNEDLRNVNNSGIYTIETSVDVKRIFGFLTRLRDETRDSLHATGSPAWIAKQIEDFVSHLHNPTFNFRRQRSSNYLNVKVRPDAQYQWGLVDSIPSDDVAEGSYPGRGVTDYYDIRSGMTFQFINVKGGYDNTINRTFSYGGDEFRTVTVKYPNLNLDILRLESLPLLKKWIRSSSISTALNQSIEKRYDESDSLISDSKGINLSPLLNWQSTWNNGMSTTFDFTYSVTDATNYSGVTPVPSKILNWGGSANFGYTFSAPRGLGLPFLKGLKFKSNLTFNLGFRYSRSTNYFTNLDRPANDASTIAANLGLSYNFSSSITGGANLDYSQNSDKNSNQDTRRIGLNIWTNIQF